MKSRNTTNFDDDNNNNKTRQNTNVRYLMQLSRTIISTFLIYSTGFFLLLYI